MIPQPIGKICASIGQEKIEDAVAAAQTIAKDVDVIEIRLDTLKSPAVTPFVTALKKPLLFTCRPEWEGGFYIGEETARIDLLVEAIELGASYIDLELLAPDESFSRISKVIQDADAELIVSNHNFSKTPPRKELLEILSGMKARGANIGKIVTTAQNYLDVLRVLELQTDAAEDKLALIAFCMGQAGVISRLGTLELGGFMTYCSAESEEAMAPGQIPVKTMHELIRLLHPA